jgi:hypothetical protein
MVLRELSLFNQLPSAAVRHTRVIASCRSALSSVRCNASRSSWQPPDHPETAAAFVVRVGSGSPAALPGGGTAERVLTGRNRRSRRLFDTTKTDENAIAAPASIGFSSPAAASGRAATL